MVDLSSVETALRLLGDRSNVSVPEPAELRRTAEQFATRTEFGNFNFSTTVKNRSAGLTVYLGSETVRQRALNPRQQEIVTNAPNTIEKVLRYLESAPFVRVDRNMGDNTQFNPHCSCFVSVHRPEMIRLAYMWGQTLFDSKPDVPGPQEYLVYIPEWQEKDRQALVFPEIGVTFVLGSDYFGETKKGFLRKAMWFAKQEGMLGLHAGSKIVRARDRDGNLRRYGVLIFGLTATGKTTHTCHDHGLSEDGEGIDILQDDIVMLRADGSALGTEDGFYLKTEGVDPESQPLIHKAAISEDTVFENVMVDYQGNVDFNDGTLTGNGRGIMKRGDLRPFITDSIDLPPISELDALIFLFITRRNTIVPLCSKLNAAQAAAHFMLGESIESTGGDPKRAGESIRSVGTNPFLIGSEADEGNWLYSFLQEHGDRVQAYLLNTGGVGEIIERTDTGDKKLIRPALRPWIPGSAALIRGIVKGTVEWVDDPAWDTQVAVSVPDFDLSEFEVGNFYDQSKVDCMTEELRNERIKWLEQFPTLEPVISASIKVNGGAVS